MQDMRDLYRAYSAVHDTTIKEELDTSKDQISVMNLGQLTEGDLLEVCEEIVEGLFQYGCVLDTAYEVVGSMMEATTEGELPAHRQQKIVRISEAFDKVFEKVATRAERNCEEEFLKYRTNKPLNEKWNSKLNNEVGNEKLHNALIHEDRETIKGGLIEMISKVIEEKKDSSYLETDMKKREKNNEKARKDMEKVPGQKNPHFEEVSTLRQGWTNAYASIYEKKMDPVGQEDGDIDNDGDKDSSDKYLAKRRKAIGKAMKKEGYMPMNKAKVDSQKSKAYNKDMAAQSKGDTKEADKQFKRRMAMDFQTKMKKEEVSFSETELKAFEEIVNSWVD
ncbi:hypothetical protein OAF61_02135 [Pseudomonadales bacterium]|nr:hypothetical protein [Pseudomonadales bacterium]